jgi:hypothetical protein
MSKRCRDEKCGGPLLYTWNHPSAPGCLRLVCLRCGALDARYQPVGKKAQSHTGTISDDGENPVTVQRI